MLGYRIRTAVRRGRDVFGRVFARMTVSRASASSALDGRHAQAAQMVSRHAQRGAGWASAAALLLALVLPGSALAACPNLPFTHVGETLTVVIDPSCDAAMTGLAPAMGVDAMAYDEFSVTTANATYQFNYVPFDTSNTYTVTLASGRLAMDSVPVFVTSNTTPGSVTDTQRNLLITLSPPSITSVAPGSGTTAGGTPVTIQGSGLGSTTSVMFGNVLASNVTINGANSITATSPASAIGAGAVDLRVTTAAGTATLTNAFTYVTPTPAVTSITPNTGSTDGGTDVTITGTNFTGATSVNFGGVAGTNVVVVSATSITARAPAHVAGPVDVTVTTPGGTSATSPGDLFNYVVLQPTVTGIAPNKGSAAGGTAVVITGTNFTGATSVNFGGVAGTNVAVLNATTITAFSPAHIAGPVDVTVTTPGGTSATGPGDLFTYFAPPAVTSVSPNAGPVGGGTSITISGTDFLGATSVTFNGAPATTFTINSANMISAITPAGGVGTVDIRVTTPNGTSALSAADQFTYAAAPTVNGVTPSSGPASGGTTVTINGTGFSSDSSVKFGATAATITVNSATQITATSPAHAAGTVDITVKTPGGTSATSGADQFTYVPAPTVTGIAPNSGPGTGGTTVTINGTNFGSVSAVTFGGTAAASYSVDSNLQITATAPAGFGTVDVRVTTDGGTSATSANDQFTYFSAPVITSISPTVGSPAGGTHVTIAGANFTGATGVSFGGVAATNVVVNTDSSITANSPAGTGTVDVRVTGPNGTSAINAADRFTYATVPDAPGLPTATAGNGRATVDFAPPASDGGATIIHYTVTSRPGGLTATGSIHPLTITGLDNGTPYTFTVTATNNQGTSVASIPSNSVTPGIPQTITITNPGPVSFGTSPTLVATADSGRTVTFSSRTPLVCTIAPSGQLTLLSANICTIDADQAGGGEYLPAPTATLSMSIDPVAPGTPVMGTATAGNGQATVTFIPASNGGLSSVSYTVESSPGNFTATGTSGPITVTGLANGTAYTFTVKAFTSAGNSGTSSASNSVTPQGPQTITFANPGAKTFGTSPTLVATSTSALPVTFTSSTTNVCTVSPLGTLTTISPGSCTINADQIGDGAFLPATQVSQTFSIVVPGGAVMIDTASTLPNATAEANYHQTIQASGGAQPYSFTVLSGSLPGGLTLTPSTGEVSGSPNVAGTFNFTVQVTDAATQTAVKTFLLTIAAPTVVITPGNAPGGQVGVSYSLQFDASGGAAGSYTYTSTPGALPAGLTLSPSGLLSGTPTQAGSFPISVTATDRHGFFGTQSYTVSINQPVPVAANDTASTPANATLSIAVATNDTGPISSIAVAQAPGHGTAAINGLNVEYVPNNNFFGTDSFTYTATGPGGTSAPATVTITVTPLAVPVAQPLSATVLAGKTVTLHAAQGATGGPFTAVAVATPPATGTLTINGTDIVYTPALDAEGAVNFDYTLSNAFGTSLPAHVTVMVNPVPTAPALTANVLAGLSVQVDLTSTAHGGPFTDATLVSVSPSNAGTASIKAVAGGYALTFTSAASFSGTAQLSYTLSNAYATSAPGSISVLVAARPDPSKDTEVLGILNAQADSARRLAQGQISNFQQRLESLHNGGGGSGFTNGITLSSASMQNRDPMQALRKGDNDNGSRRYLIQPEDPTTGPSSATSNSRGLPGGFAVWTGGALNFGKTQPGSSHNGIDFTTSGVSLGVDKRVNDAFAFGAGVGYGHDASDIGQHGSRSTTDSYSVAFYGSYRPTTNVYVDGLLGYQWLSFDARRYVTGDGSVATGSRDGKQWFGSLAFGYEQRGQNWLLSPYARLDVAQAHLDAYTEQGQATDALSFARQSVKTTTGNLGLRAQWAIKADYGQWLPTLRAEYEHDFQGSGVANMRYADLTTGPLYQATLVGQSSNRTMLGAGIQLQTLKGWLLRFEYQNLFQSSSSSNQSLLLGVEKKFE